jgi:peptidoglycan/LPS O-acetylase OafA/YrhL
VRKSIGHIPSLDGLRAVSFLLVFLGHGGLDRFVPGGFGVTVFFFLSGFLITTLMRTEYESRGRVDFGGFWLRRALRILPPFYLVLLGATLTTILIAPGTLLWEAAAARALHVTNYWLIYHGYDGEPAGTGVYWSLAVEEHFYLAFPWLYVGLQKLRLPPRNQAITFWGLCLVVLIWRWILVEHLHAPINRTYMASDTRIDSILFGCALAVWRNPVLDDDLKLNEGLWKHLIVPGALLVLGLCLVARGEAFRETLRYTLQGAALTFIFTAAIRFWHWGLFRWLSWRPVAFIGVLSYSLYLLHYNIIFVVHNLLSTSALVVQAAVALCLSVGLAWLIYVTVEKPCAQLRKRLSESRNAGPVAVSPSSVAQ